MVFQKRPSKGSGKEAHRRKRAKTAARVARSRANAPDAAATSSSDPGSDEEESGAASPLLAPAGTKRKGVISDDDEIDATITAPNPKRRCVESDASPSPPASIPGWLFVFSCRGVCRFFVSWGVSWCFLTRKKIFY